MSGRARYTVKDVMTATVVAVKTDASFKEIVAAMRQWHITGMPVLDDEGHVVGMVSEADLLAKEELRDKDPMLLDQRQRLEDFAKAGGVLAGDLMTSPAVTITRDATLPQAARLMAERRVKRLPVVDDAGMIRGVISRSDLLKVFLRPDDDIAAEVSREVVDRLFPLTRHSISVTVHAGAVTLHGPVGDAALVPLAERLAYAVEGVVTVHCHLVGPVTAAAGPL